MISFLPYKPYMGDKNHLSIMSRKEKTNITAQKMKFSVKDFFSKCDQICKKLRIWSHLLKKSLLKNFISYAVYQMNEYILNDEKLTQLKFSYLYF